MNGDISSEISRYIDPPVILKHFQYQRLYFHPPTQIAILPDRFRCIRWRCYHRSVRTNVNILLNHSFNNLIGQPFGNFQLRTNCIITLNHPVTHYLKQYNTVDCPKNRLSEVRNYSILSLEDFQILLLAQYSSRIIL